jgi:fructokinase
VRGANGLTGEFGHIPMPFTDASDFSLVSCVCGQKGCIDKSINGAALARLYTHRTTEVADAVKIAALAANGDHSALAVLDEYYTQVAKAMAMVIHIYDPHVIAVSGGLNALPGLYEQVPKRWGQFCMIKNPKTKFLPAKHGAVSGLRGAAWLGRSQG